jgi:hypothetical protein
MGVVKRLLMGRIIARRRRARTTGAVSHLAIVEVTGITTAAASGGKAMLGFQNGTLPMGQAPATESQVTHPVQQFLGSALRRK